MGPGAARAAPGVAMEVAHMEAVRLIMAIVYQHHYNHKHPFIALYIDQIQI